MDYAGNLRRLRRERGLTQKELAEQLGLSTSAIGGYESGHRTPDIKTLVKIANLFDTTTDELLGINDNRFPVSDLDGYHDQLEEQFFRLRNIYPQLPEFVKEMIHNTIDVVLKQYDNN